MTNLQVWYADQYQMKLGPEYSLALKINLIKNAMDTLNKEDHNSGVLDAAHVKEENTLENNAIKYTRFQ